jgi:hypothetical protein
MLVGLGCGSGTGRKRYRPEKAMKLAPETSGPGRRDFNGGGLGVKPGVGGAPARFVEDIGDRRSKWRASSHETVEAETRRKLAGDWQPCPVGPVDGARAPMGSSLLRGLQLAGGAGMVLEKRLQKQTGPKLPVRLTGPRAGAQRTGVLSTGVMDKTVTPKEPGGTGTRSAGFTQRVLENIAALQEHRATGYDPGRACEGGVR